MKTPLAAVTAALVATAAAADSRRAPLPPAYVEECGSCHVAFPGPMLDAASWQAVLDGLPKHFGVDASLDPQALAPIRAYLERSARGQASGGEPLLRITETRWFRHEHDEVPAGLWTGPGAVKPSDCGACHTRAASGSYAESELRMPAKGVAR